VLHKQVIPTKSKSLLDEPIFRVALRKIKALKPITERDWDGDCVQIDFCPSMIRQLLVAEGIKLKTRQLDLNTYRIWRLE